MPDLLRRLRHLPLLLALAAGGCGLLGSGPSEQQLAQARAARLLSDLVDSFTGDLEISGQRIAAGADNNFQKRLSVNYRMRLSRAARTSLGYRDPRVGLLDLWTLLLQAQQFLTEGTGARLFGERSELAVAAVQRSLEQIGALAADVFGDEQAAAARRDVEAFAERHPMRQHFARVGLLESDIAIDAGEDGANPLLKTLTFDWINPLSGFGSDVTEGAAAVGAAMDRFTVAAEFLPRQLGWQLELFVYTLEDAEAVHEVVAGTTRVAEGVDRVAGLAEHLPERLRQQIDAVLHGLGPTLQQVQQTLAAARESAGPIAEVGSRWGAAAQQLEAMAQQLADTLAKFDGTYRMLDGGDRTEAEPEPPAGEAARPFDVLEWAQTARSIKAMSEELQQTLDAFRRTVAAPELDQTLTKAEDMAGNAAAAVFLWVLLGAAIVFALAVLAVHWLRALARQRRRDAA